MQIKASGETCLFLSVYDEWCRMVEYSDCTEFLKLMYHCEQYCIKPRVICRIPQTGSDSTDDFYVS